MKRHDKLIPYSRFHRKILFLALIAKRNAPNVKNYPTLIADKIDYALAFYDKELTAHFNIEERELFEYYKNKDPEVDILIKDLTTEREELKRLFNSLSVNREKETLHQLGKLLELHVRKEERVFFQLLQQKFLE